ncbi:sugar fermentation stimulation protein A [Clostridiales bacterium]|nr:sugar fermentation stimulation protein A [Clostridiales bacterium]
MEYKNIIEAIFVKRLNRFLAEVIINGKNEMVHVKNTGRLRELLIDETKVFLEESDNADRKTKYSLIAVYKEGEIVNIDSQAPNIVAYEAIKKGVIKELGIPDIIKKEVKYKNSRFDIYYEVCGTKGFVEVKGVTLDENKTAKFPDAPTKRGTKHIRELIDAHREGYECSILFVIQMKGTEKFCPNAERDLEFAKALEDANTEGVNILAYDCIVGKNSMEIDRKIKAEMATVSY